MAASLARVLFSRNFRTELQDEVPQSRCLHRCLDCYPVERTNSRAALPPSVDSESKALDTLFVEEHHFLSRVS